MHIFRLKNPKSLQEYQFEFDLVGTDFDSLRLGVFFKLEQLGITGDFPVKVITNYGTKVWMIHHSVERKFTWQDKQFTADESGWKQLQNSSPLSCLLVDEQGELGIDIDGCSASFAIKLLNDGYFLRMDTVVIGYREVSSYNVIFEI